MGDVINKAESYSTANQHLLVKKLLLVILMITIIVNMVSFFFLQCIHELFFREKKINLPRISLNSFSFFFFIL